MKIIRRLSGNNGSAGRSSCPEFFELDNGDFALIGEDISTTADSILPPDASLNATERLIRVPRILVTSAKHNIPDE